MNRTTDVVAVSGSLSTESATRVALRAVLESAAAEGARTTLLDLREYDLPTFDADDRDAGDAPELRRRLAAADAVVLGTPMYHGSYSSPLKTALDYSSADEFADTTVGVLGVSGGAFPTRALDHLRTVVRALDAWPLPLDVAVPNSHEAVVDGALADEDVAARARRLGRAVVRYADVAARPDVETESPSPSTAD